MRYRDFEGDDPYERPSSGHSIIGIASFFAALAAGILEMGVVIISAIMDSQDPVGLDEDSPQAIVLGLAFVGGMFVNIMGLILGIVALFERRSNKTFAWLGLGIGAAVLLGGLLVIVAGIVATMTT